MHRGLDGEQPHLPEWLLSRICEEFGCRPSEALEEDAALVMDILELRHYAQVKALVEDPNTDEDRLQAIGVDEATLSNVMENIARRTS